MKLSARAENMEWRSTLALWPYACLAFTAIGFLYPWCFVSFNPVRRMASSPGFPDVASDC
jgi:hypothetical protein